MLSKSDRVGMALKVLTYSFFEYCFRSCWVTTSSSSGSFAESSESFYCWVACSNISRCITYISYYSSLSYIVMNFLICPSTSWSRWESSRMLVILSWSTTEPLRACSCLKRFAETNSSFCSISARSSSLRSDIL